MNLQTPTFIQYGTLTEEQWLKMCVCEIHTPSNKSQVDKRNTPYDPRLGPLENGIVCETCGQQNIKCSGHWGYINLAEPCYNPHFIGNVLNILKCICIGCNKLLLTKEEIINKGIMKCSGEKRIKAFINKTKTIKVCPHNECKTIIPQMTIDDKYIYYFYDDKTKKQQLNARIAYNILSVISNEDLPSLGINTNLSSSEYFKDLEGNHTHAIRPESFIITILPVLPTCIRPWVTQGDEKKDDDISEIYRTILRLNKKLKTPTILSQPSKTKKVKTREQIIERINTYIWNIMCSSAVKSTTSRSIKSVEDRLSGKEGHIQNNCSGKRVNYSARTVIDGGGTLIPMGWMGIPPEAAQDLTYRECVQPYNINYLSKGLPHLDSEGNIFIRSPRIVTIHRRNLKIDVAKNTQNYTRSFIYPRRTPTNPDVIEVEGLLIGDIVDRELKDGDEVFLNRQPTLRKESMQGVKVKIILGEKIFRLPLGVTRAFNADFDEKDFSQKIRRKQETLKGCFLLVFF